MAYISFNPKDFFNTVLFSGTAAGQSITGVGFQPDFVWGKSILVTGNHQLLDVPRGVGKPLESDTGDAEASDPGSSLSSFDSDGFTLAGGSAFNPSGTNNVISYNWKAATSTGVDFSGGDITPSAYSIDTTSGIGIYKYTGPGTVGGDTIAHNLGATPKLVIVKRLSDDYSWAVQHADITSTKIFNLNENVAEASNDAFNNTGATSTLITLGSSTYTNAAAGTSTYVCYAFAPVKGYSSFGTYIGNASNSGPYVYTGFRPAFVLIKRTDSTGAWYMYDNRRAGYNGVSGYIQANSSSAEDSASAGNFGFDFYANAFQMKGVYATVNADNGNYIYAAFAEQPIVGQNGTPGVGR